VRNTPISPIHLLNISMFKRIPQPPVSRSLRAREGHDFWGGFVVALTGAALLYCGARHLTKVETVDGGTAWESQLVKAFSASGLKYGADVQPPPPPRLDNVANPAEALDRWAKAKAAFQPPAWKIRVDTAAHTPCPT